VTAALVARRDPALVVPAAGLLDGLDGLFSGSVFVISAKSETVMKRRPGLVGLNFFVGMA
jgi:hypothetical protein